MSNEIQAVMQLYADFSRGDVDAVLASCSDDCRWTIPGSNDAVNDTYVGREAIAAFIAGLLAAVNIESFTPESIYQDGDWIVAIGHYGGTMRATRESFGRQWLHCWRLRNEEERDSAGRVCSRFRAVSFDDSYDTLVRYMSTESFMSHAA